MSGGRFAYLPALLAAGVLVTATPATASDYTPTQLLGALGKLQFEDSRLQAIGWRLSTANARYCKVTAPAAGLLLQDMMNYDEPDRIREAIGLQGDVAVQAVAKGSPAALAGLAPNQEVVAIDGLAMTDLPPAQPGDFERLKMLHDRIDAALATKGSVELMLPGRDLPLVVEGVPACRSRFELRTEGAGAQADGHRVLIGRKFGNMGKPSDRLEEAEYAAAIAHELAHNILDHRDWLDRAGRSWGNLRRAEREADRLTVWLLANGGFDLQAAPRLMRGWGRRKDGGFLRIPTHEGWDERAALMEAEIERVNTVLKATGEADWTLHFLRE